MAKVSKEDLNNIKINVDFVKLAEENGFNILHGESSQKSTTLTNKDINSKIVISRNANQHLVFYDFKEASNKYKGTVIDFTQSYLNKDYVEAIHFLNDLNKNEGHKVTYDQVLQAKVENQKLVSQDYFSFDSIKYTKYLNDRGISNETLKSKLFKKNIGEKTFISNSSKKPYNSIVFPMYHNISGKVVGLEKKNALFSGSFKHSDKKNSFWKSNPISNKPDLIIVESGIDALSHYQLNKNKNAFYIATNGHLSNERLEVLKNYVERRKGRFNSVSSAMDNDIAGTKFNIKILGGINIKGTNENINFSLESNQHHASLIVRSTEKKKIHEVASQLHGLNNSLDLTSSMNQQYRFNDKGIKNKGTDDKPLFELIVHMNNRITPLKPIEKIVKDFKETPIKVILPEGKDFGSDLEHKLGIQRFSNHEIVADKNVLDSFKKELENFSKDKKSIKNVSFKKKGKNDILEFSYLKTEGNSKGIKNLFKEYNDKYNLDGEGKFNSRKIKNVWEKTSLKNNMLMKGAKGKNDFEQGI